MEKQQRLVLVIAILASFVAFLDGSVINVALPAISRELGGGLTIQQWVVDAYLITLGSLILVAGSLSDVFGRVAVLRWGLLGFGVTSLLCAVAPTGEFLVVARGLQGVAGALLVPSSLALIMSSFRDAAQAKAIGLWTGWTFAAFVVGPLVGGLFVDLLSWRFVFLINLLPIAVTVWFLVLLTRHAEPEAQEKQPTGSRIDYPGAVLGVLGLGGPVYGLIEQARYGWGSPVIYVPFGLGLVAFAAFLWRERTAKAPMMPLALFQVRNFAVGNIATTAIYGALAIGGLLVVVFLQQVGGYTATAAGLSMVPVTVISASLSSFFGGLAGRFGPRLFMSAGPITAGIGYLLLLRVTESANYWTEVLPGVVVFGLGLSITVAPLTAAILGSIDARQAGIGSAINNAVSRVAGLITVAFLGVIVGSKLDLVGFQRGLLVTAGLLILGGIISAVGISNHTAPAVIKEVVRR
jgi:EmrB/QacA subfamily drug resistance transporter